MVNQPLSMDLPTALLGGLAPATFMRRYWQREPLLVRGAWPHQTFVTRTQLTALAASEDVESRLVVREGREWRLEHGPLSRGRLPPWSQPHWTLLVQGVDLHVEAAHQFMRQFSFVPWARLDDVMVSMASDGGGVGPHTDEYDVFLVQLEGRRRWRVGPVEAPRWRRDVPLKQLRGFVPTMDRVLEPGDMLYVPPGWGHDGIAQGTCVTASVGFRAPRADELSSQLMVRMAEASDDEPEVDGDTGGALRRRFRDARTLRREGAGAIPHDLVAFARRAVAERLRDPDALALALGEWLTEPKEAVWFDRGAKSEGGADSGGAKDGAGRSPERDAGDDGVRLDRRSRMLYDAEHIYLNGESFEVSGADAEGLKRLADTRHLSAADLRRMTRSAREAMRGWIADGWMHGKIKP